MSTTGTLAGASGLTTMGPPNSVAPFGVAVDAVATLPAPEAAGVLEFLELLLIPRKIAAKIAPKVRMATRPPTMSRLVCAGAVAASLSVASGRGIPAIVHYAAGAQRRASSA